MLERKLTSIRAQTGKSWFLKGAACMAPITYTRMASDKASSKLKMVLFVEKKKMPEQEEHHHVEEYEESHYDSDSKKDVGLLIPFDEKICNKSTRTHFGFPTEKRVQSWALIK